VDWGNYQVRPRVRESATYLARASDGELAQYLVRLCELPNGRWNVHLMALPWDSHEAENTFSTAEQACEVADALYAMGLDGGRWDTRRWGWRRPEPAAGPSGAVGQG
jgi:hypothetical protein